MTSWRVAACLAALFFWLASITQAADVSYSGIPGKWRRGGKTAKATSSETGARPKETRTKKIIDNGKLKVTVGPKRG